MQLKTSDSLKEAQYCVGVWCFRGGCRDDNVGCLLHHLDSGLKYHNSYWPWSLTDIVDIDHDDTGDTLTLQLVTLAGKSYHLSTDISQHLL